MIGTPLGENTLAKLPRCAPNLVSCNLVVVPLSFEAVFNRVYLKVQIYVPIHSFSNGILTIVSFSEIFVAHI